MSIYRLIKKSDGTAIGPPFQYTEQAKKYLEKKYGNSPYIKIKKVR